MQEVQKLSLKKKQNGCLTQNCTIKTSVVCVLRAEHMTVICAGYTYRCKEVCYFLSFGFNTKIQRYLTLPSQILTFTLEPKFEEKGEEKRLLGGGRWAGDKVKQQIPGALRFTRPVTIYLLSHWTTGLEAEL